MGAILFQITTERRGGGREQDISFQGPLVLNNLFLLMRPSLFLWTPTMSNCDHIKGLFHRSNHLPKAFQYQTLVHEPTGDISDSGHSRPLSNGLSEKVLSVCLKSATIVRWGLWEELEACNTGAKTGLLL